MTYNQAFFPTKVITGEGSINSIADLIDNYESENIVVFADPIIVKLNLTQSLERIFSEKNINYKIFSEIEPEPSIELGESSIDVVREFDADLVIGIGGGSCLDCAKVAATLADNEGNIRDYLNLSGNKKIKNSGVKKVLIPTTAGTGAEITFNAVFSLGKTKDVITDEKLLATAAVVDPELTYTLPPRVTAGSGVDALCHAIESYTSKGATEITDVLAIKAIEKLYKNLRTAVWNGEDKVARREMAMGSLLASLSYFNSGVHAVHALSYPLGGLYKIPHGESNAVLLPYVFDGIWTASLDRMKDLAVAMEIPTAGKTQREIALEVNINLKYLVKDVGLPISLKEYGIKKADLNQLAKEAGNQKRLLGKSPKSLNEKDIEQIFEASYNGQLINE